MRIIALFFKILFYISIVITVFFNILIILPINKYAVALMNENKATIIGLIIITTVGLAITFAMAIMKKWGLATIVSFIAAVAITLISYSFVKKGLKVEFYLRNHLSSLFVPLFALLAYIFNRFSLKER